MNPHNFYNVRTGTEQDSGQSTKLLGSLQLEWIPLLGWYALSLLVVLLALFI